LNKKNGQAAFQQKAKLNLLRRGKRLTHMEERRRCFSSAGHGRRNVGQPILSAPASP
jgi:hypothetical protein